MTTNYMLPLPTGGIIAQSTIPIFVLCHAKAATIKPRMCVESANDGDTDDLLEIVYGSANSKRITGWALYNDANKKTLSKNNATITTSTAFTTGDGVWIGMRIPAVLGILSTGQGTIVPGQKLACAGAGLLKTSIDDLAGATYGVTTAVTTYYLNTTTPLSGKYFVDATIAISLSHLTTADATQEILVAPLW